MSVYVDPLHPTLRSYEWKFSEGSHLIADSDDELHAFAVRLGLKLGWFQGTSTISHYDLTANKREQAVRMGAVEITHRQMAERIRAQRELRKEAAHVCG